MREGRVGSSDAMEGKRDGMEKNSPDLFYLRAGKWNDERGEGDGRWGKGRGRVVASGPATNQCDCMRAVYYTLCFAFAFPFRTQLVRGQFRTNICALLGSFLCTLLQNKT
jgi:hypothetical protein